MANQAEHLALILQAIEDVDREMANYRVDYKARRETLEQQAWKLRNQILSGQLTITDVMEKVAAQVNAGALDAENVKCTAEVRK
jgi:predicted metal-dependent hydrolase